PAAGGRDLLDALAVGACATGRPDGVVDAAVGRHGERVRRKVVEAGPEGVLGQLQDHLEHLTLEPGHRVLTHPPLATTLAALSVRPGPPVGVAARVAGVLVGAAATGARAAVVTPTVAVATTVGSPLPARAVAVPAPAVAAPADRSPTGSSRARRPLGRLHRAA